MKAMRFPSPLTRGVLIRRTKRFLAEVRLPDGRDVVAHCPNPGRMPDLALPGSEVWLAPATGAGRRLDWSWKLVREAPTGAMVLVDTVVANRIVAEALAGGLLPDLGPIASVRAEVGYAQSSRVDFLLTHPDGAQTLLEVKSVSLARAGIAAFPDAPSQRATHHMQALAAEVAPGRRAAVVFLRVRSDPLAVGIAADIDPALARAVVQAQAAGVRMLALGCDVGPEAVVATGPVPFVQ
jgi:sugar fermentation stimulation protein A